MFYRSRWWVLAALVGCSNAPAGDDGDDDDVAANDDGPGVNVGNAADYAADVLITGLAASTTGNPVQPAEPPLDPYACLFDGVQRTDVAGQAGSISFVGCDNGYGRVLDGALTFANDPAGSAAQPRFAVDASLSVTAGSFVVSSQGRYDLVVRLGGGALADLELIGDELAVTAQASGERSNQITIYAFDIHASTFVVLDHGPLTSIDAAFQLASARLHDTLGVATTQTLQHDFLAAHPESGALTVAGDGDSHLAIVIHGDETYAQGQGQLELRVARGTRPPSAPLWVTWADLVQRARTPAQ